MADTKPIRRAVVRNNDTAKEVSELFKYDPETGQIWRRVGNPDTKGYLTVSFRHKNTKAHIVAWVLTYGEWPPGPIDHRNGIRSDNRISNLRLATTQQNALNRKVRIDSKSGHTGVFFQKNRGAWVAYVYLPGHKKIHLGCFKSREEAANARRRAAASYHGEFYRYS